MEIIIKCLYWFLEMTYKGLFIVHATTSLLVFVSTCLMLEDNREKCWTQMIPFYGTYIRYRAFWDNKYFFITLVSRILSFISLVLFFVFSILSLKIAIAIPFMIISMIIYLESTIIVILFSVVLIYNISKTYGYDGGFTFGLCCLPMIFYTILGIKCLKKGVLKRISKGRVAFIIIVFVVFALLNVWLYRNHLKSPLEILTSIEEARGGYIE